MFTGIIEQLGKIIAIRTEGTNRILEIHTPFPDAIRVDQSIAHNGVCLTVTDIFEQRPEYGARYAVTAVQETLEKTQLGQLRTGDSVNIERCMKAGDRLDGHFVQGHVDGVGEVISVEERDGSWMYHFRFDPAYQALVVDKGSICINGVSLTVVQCIDNTFSVTIIPYTYAHTTFRGLKAGDAVNLEFDILGKYILKFHHLAAQPKS
jgi:riboflavin synthase